MASPNEKGNALEYGVHCIEEAMHRNVPGLKGSNAVIERNKIIVKDGVSHEIDLWVRVNPETICETSHVLECKNWNRPVGTDEVFKLAGKMKALNAASGTIIAREFTSDAEALAKTERCLSLHCFADNFWSPLDSLQCAATTHAVDNANLTVQFRNPSPDNTTTFDHQTSVCRCGGQITGLQGFLSPLIDRHIRAIQAHDPRSRLEGEHAGHAQFGYEFDSGEFFINDHEVAHLTVSLDYTVSVRHARIAVKFDVEHRGGFIRMEYPPGTFGHKDVALEIVTKASKPFQKSDA
jgi:hypothetical protein